MNKNKSINIFYPPHLLFYDMNGIFAAKLRESNKKIRLFKKELDTLPTIKKNLYNFLITQQNMR